eukprot:145736_1
MQLINVHADKQIKIQFNLESMDLDGFYTSLHPRLMDIKFDNAFDIALPSINEGKLQSISFRMSIILHNFEEFHTGYSDLSSLNLKLMTQNMDHGTKSYKVADCLSIFYGLS